jgi:transposase
MVPLRDIADPLVLLTVVTGGECCQTSAPLVIADLRGASLNLDGGCDAARHRHAMFHAGLIPNITESPRQRKTTKRGRTRRFDAAIHALRMRVERTSAWEDTCQRLWLRFERLQQRHSGMKWLA